MTIQKWKLNSWLIFLFCLLIQSGIAQSKSQLKKKKAKIHTEIKKLNGLLSETQTNKRKSEIQLLILNKKIGARKDLISTIKNEVSYIEEEIINQNSKINTLKSRLSELRSQYVKMVQFAYKNRNATNKLIFIFSSEDFNQAYKRIKYINEIAEHRKYQSQQIELVAEDIELKILELEEKKFRKLNLKEYKKAEFRRLQKEQGERQNLYVELRKDEFKLKTDLANKKNESKKLQAAIKRIIEREIEEAKKRAEKSSEGIGFTPKAKKLSKDFTNNKGKLPWPVTKGVISGKFGNQKHAVYEHLTTINNGIDIITNSGTKARSVFKGKVAAVIVLPGGKKAVLIQHGEFFTMYSNLAKVFVNKGDEVTTREDIATVLTDENGKTEIHFEIWQGNQKQNPGFWIVSN